MNIKKSTYPDLEKKLGKLTFASFIKSWRLCDENSQTEFAKKLKISKQNLCDLEKGRRSLSLNKVISMAKILGLSPQVLIQLYVQDELRKAKVNCQVIIK